MSQEFRIEIPQIDPRWSRSLMPLVAIVIAGLALLSSSVYSVGTESVGVIQRFGKYTGTVDPGLRFKLPFGIDRVTILPVKRQEVKAIGPSSLEINLGSREKEPTRTSDRTAITASFRHDVDT